MAVVPGERPAAMTAAVVLLAVVLREVAKVVALKEAAKAVALKEEAKAGALKEAEQLATEVVLPVDAAASEVGEVGTVLEAVKAMQEVALVEEVEMALVVSVRVVEDVRE